MIGPLSYVGLVLILFFILSFFIKQQNILTKIQKIEYQNIKLEITLNILVFIAGLLFLYFDYTKNYQELNDKYSTAQQNVRDTVKSVTTENEKLKDALARIETVNYEFEVRLAPVDASNNFPEASDLECYYKETKKTPRRKALIDQSAGGEEGTYKIFLFNINKSVADIPILEIKDRKGNVWGWDDQDNITIIPPLINLNLKFKQ